METTAQHENILLTGATSGLGLDIANKLSAAGSALTITGRNGGVLTSLSEKFSSTNPSFQKAIKADLTIQQDIEVLASQVEMLSGLVLCAGIIDYTPAKFINREKIESVFSTNVYASILLVQQLLKSRKIAKGASIVFISSVSALKGVVGTSLYAASKGAINSYAKVLAAELATQKIRVNVISPGVIQTNLIEKENVVDSSGFIKLREQHPLGLGSPSDVSDLVLFLLSNRSSWITGSNIVIDGGFTIN